MTLMKIQKIICQGERDRFVYDQNSERIPVPQYASISASWEPYRTSRENINKKQEEEKGNQFREIQICKKEKYKKPHQHHGSIMQNVTEEY